MNIDLQRAFGKRVAELRKAKGYSQESFADACVLHRSYMGNVERGKINLSLENQAKIARGLAITLSELMTGIEKMAKDGSSHASKTAARPAKTKKPTP